MRGFSGAPIWRRYPSGDLDSQDGRPAESAFHLVEQLLLTPLAWKLDGPSFPSSLQRRPPTLKGKLSLAVASHSKAGEFTRLLEALTFRRSSFDRFPKYRAFLRRLCQSPPSGQSRASVSQNQASGNRSSESGRNP